MDKYQRGWQSGRPETVCGAGSTLAATRLQRLVLAQWAREYAIRHIADIGAGDLNWIRHVEWPHSVFYTAYDLVPRSPEVIPFNIIEERAPRVDALLCLWVLNHLAVADAQQALRNLRESGSKYLIYTWWPGMHESLNAGYEWAVTIKPEKQAELRIARC